MKRVSSWRGRAEKPSLKLFQTLRLTPTASKAEITKAYRTLALEYHPDRCGNDPEAKGKWEAVRKAYEILSEPERMRAYDRDELEQYERLQAHKEVRRMQQQ
eukprot:RCo010218